MKYLAPRNENYGMDLKICEDMLGRAEIGELGKGTDISVQELINLVSDLLDGERNSEISDKVGADKLDRVLEIRDSLRPLWTYADGRKVIG